MKRDRYNINEFVELKSISKSEPSEEKFSRTLLIGSCGKPDQNHEYIQARIYTHGEPELKFPGWKFFANKNLKMEGLWVSIFRTKKKTFSELIDLIHKDRYLNSLIEFSVQELPPPRKAKNFDVERKSKPRQNITTSSDGMKIIRSKYKYPDDIKTPSSRSKYRREQRKLKKEKK